MARLLVLVLLITGVPVDYTRPAWAGSPTAPVTPVAQALTVGNYTLVSTTRFNRTRFDFTYTATLTNASSDTFQNVTATLTSRAATTQVIDGKLTFGDIGPGAVIRSQQDTFTIRQDRTVPFNPADLVWTVSYNHPPTAEAGPDRSVPLQTTVQLDGSGASDVDGDTLTYHWTLTPPPGSNAILSDPTAVKPTFTVDVRGNYVAQLIVHDGVTESQPDTVTVSTVNSKPVANAGPDQTVPVGARVTLDGSGSSDVDGDKLSYAWSLVALPPGVVVVLESPDQVNPRFTIDKPGDYHVQLIVSDGQIESEADIVIVSTENSPPVANAGPAQTVRVNDTVTLDGSGSSDRDGDPLTYTWALLRTPPGSQTTLFDPTTVHPHFVVDKPGTYVAQLLVRDGKADSLPATVTISTENSQPVANAGPDQTVALTSTVILDGSGSHDADGDPLGYQWTLTTVPPGSQATLSQADTLNPTFVADRPGDYLAQLIVRDATSESAPDTVKISTLNSKPIAQAGSNQTAYLNDLVTLDGSGSTDPDGDALTFAWSLLHQPLGSHALLNGATTAAPSFIPDQIGPYVAQLIVSDSTLASDPATVTITARRRNQAPVITSSPVTTATAGQPYGYDVEATDPDGDALTYSLTVGPAGMTIAPGSGLIQWTPTAAQVGNHTVNVRVQDSGGLTAEQGFMLSVASPNRAPMAVDDAYTTVQDHALVTYGTVAGAAPVLVNGSFELGPEIPGEWVTLVAGSTELVGWTITNASVDIKRTYWVSSDGNRSLDLNGSNPGGAISQTFDTIVGARYQVTFDLAGNPTQDKGRFKDLRVSAGDTATDYRFDIYGHSQQSMGWTTQTFSFKANSARTALNFTSLTTDFTSWGPALDNVRISAPSGILLGVLANDSDLDGDPLTARIVSNPAHGSVDLKSDGSFTYVPNVGFAGTDTFTYKANDGALDSNVATVTITVQAVNHPPAITSTPNTAHWIQLHPIGEKPPARYLATQRTYDESNDRLIVFGGISSQGAISLNDVWVLAHASGITGTPEWKKLEPLGSKPVYRAGFVSAYDPTANRLIVYGGCTGFCNQINDAWVLTHANGLGGDPEWLPLPAGVRLGFGTGDYDPITNRLIVFGGIPGGTGSDWSNVQILEDANGIGNPKWTTLNPNGSVPPPRGHDQPGIYDPLSNTFILFGGITSGGPSAAYNDVWVLSHANGVGGTPTWTPLQPVGTAPPPGGVHTVAYDPNSARLIVYGGQDFSSGSPGQTFNDSWVLTHANGAGGVPEWLHLTPSNPSSIYHTPTIGYARASNRFIITMGYTKEGLATNDTWVLINASGNCTANQPCNYDVKATDPDPGDTLTYSLVTGPAGMSIDPATGLLQWTPTPNQIGDHAVTVQVQDSKGLSATQSFTLTVAPVAVPNVVGLAPEWGEALLQAAGLNTGAKNSLGGAITLNFDTLPSQQGWTFAGSQDIPDESKLFSISDGVLIQNTLGIGSRNAGYRILSGIDTRLPLSMAVRARVIAEEAGTSFNHFGFDFTAWRDNYFFGVGLGLDQIGIEQQPPSYAFVAFDNTSFHDYKLNARPGLGFDFIADGNLLDSGPPRIYPAQPFYALILGDVTDGPNVKAEVTSYSFTQPQIVTQNPPAGILVKSGSSVDLDIQDGPATQTVPNVVGQPQANAAAAITAAQLTVGAVTTEASETISKGSVTRQRPVAGTHIMKDFKVDLVVSSGPANKPPQIISTPVITATANQPYTYAVQATDPDVGDTLTYSLDTAPAGMSIQAGTGLIGWTPSTAQVGSQNVIVRVQDPGGLFATQSFTVTVAALPNRPPIITSAPITAATAGQPYTYDVEATDPDTSDTLSYSLVLAPTGMTIDAVTGLIQWTPAEAQVGDQSVIVQVQDSGGLLATQSFTVEVDRSDSCLNPPSSTLKLELSASIGGAGDQAGSRVVVDNGSLLVAGTNSDRAWLAKFNTSDLQQMLSQTLSASTFFTDVLPTSSGIFAVGGAVPPACGARDGVGGTEQKNMLARFTNAGEFLGCQSWTFYSYAGYEQFNAAATLKIEGVDVVYVTGAQETSGFGPSNFVTVQYDLSGTELRRAASDGRAYAMAIDGSDLIVAGYRWKGGNNFRPFVARLDSNLGLQWKVESPMEGIITGVIALAGYLYAVGYTYQSGVTGSEDYLLEKYDRAGNLIWRKMLSRSGSQFLSGIVSMQGRLFAAGGAATAGSSNIDAVLLEIDPATGDFLSTDMFGGTAADQASGIATDGNTLYVVGSTRSFATSAGNALGQSDLLLLKYSLEKACTPHITSMPVTSATVAQPYAYDVDAVDSGASGTLVYSLVSAPAGMTMDNTTGLISWMPTAVQVGSQPITVKVSNVVGRFTTQHFIINVHVPNDPPIITSSPRVIGTAGQLYSYHVQATDPNAGDTLTYSLTTAPAGMTINATGLIEWTPTTDQIGSQNVIVHVQDTGGLFAEQSFTITVSPPANQPPVITSNPVTSATAGQPYTYAVQATDPDTGDTLTYALTTAPTGMAIAPTTGLIQWTPTGAQKGANPVTVQVTDSGGLTATQSFTVTVAIPADNHPPSITSIPPLKATAGLPYTYAVVASDPDTWDVLSYRLAPAPAGMTLDPVTHVIQWTPTADQVGSQPYTLTIEDSGGLGVSQIITVAVAASVTVPDLVGLTQADAQTQLAAAQLNRGTVTTADSDTVPPGRVIRQNPAAGTIVVRASAVDLVISLGPAQVTVPNVVGQTQAAAEAALTTALLRTGTITQVNDNTVPAGQVIRQNPTAGTVVARDSAVNLTISLGPADVIVPNVVGLEQAAAQAALLAANLSVGTLTPAPSDSVSAGQVISQNPPAGSSVAQGFAVALTVSTGPAPAIVPDVVGQTQAAAQAALLAANLITGTVTSANSDTVPAGRVISQTPAAGTALPKGSPVDLVISLGPAPVVVPDLVGQTQAAATAMLTDARLAVGAITSEYSATVPAGRVIRQDPAAGAAVLPGTAVNLVLSSGPPPIPLKSILIQPGTPRLLTGQAQTFTAIGILNDGTSQTLTTGQVTWSSSNPAVATVNAGGTATARSAGTTTLQASSAGVTGTTTLTVQTRTGDGTPPVAEITAPVDNANLTSPTAVIGTATDTNFFKYELAIAPVGQTTFTNIATGTTPVTNGTLGTLDTTVLLNDLYTLRLRVYDRAYNATETSVVVQVSREQKVGNFTLAFQDLSVPTACLPLTVTRVYDSRDKTKGDFGVGWRLEVNTLRLRESQTMGTDWAIDLVNRSGPFGFPIPTYVLYDPSFHKVSLTLPDGQVEEFDLTPQPTENKFNPIGPVSLVYTPRPGTLGSLAAEVTATYAPSADTGTLELINDDYEILDPRVYRYTAPDGTVYRIDKIDGVKQVQCTNGQTLTIGPNGVTHTSGQGVSFTRDSQGRIIQISDPNGTVQDYAYDANGDLVSHTDAADQITHFSYDYRHGLLEIDDPRGVRAIRNEYDDAGRLISSTDPLGKTAEYTHDLVARTETVKDRLGNVTVYAYDDKGNVLTQTDALGQVTTFTYDAFGNQLTKTDPLGRTTTSTYDLRRHMLSETNTLGQTTQYSYTGLNAVKTLTDPLGRVTTNNYDINGNLLATTDPDGKVTTYAYDTGGVIIANTGLLKEKTDPLGHKTTYSYNSVGYLIQETDPQGHITTYTYDPNGNRLSETKTRTLPGGGTETLVTQHDYDALNRLVKTTQPDGSTTRTVYNAIGKQSQTIDPLGRVTSYEYDAAGRLVKTVYPDGTAEAASYDAEGRRLTSTDRTGRVTQYVYDPMGRLTQTVYPDGATASTTYDAAGQVIASTDALGHTTRYEYDAAGRRAKVTDALGQVMTFTYDAAGNQTAVTDANSHTTAFEYDKNNRRLKVTYADSTVETTGYDALGRQIAKTDQAGKTTRFEYDALGRLVKVTDALNQPTTYGYDELGNQLTQTDANGHTTRFAYDALGRRIGRTLPLGQRESMAYDAAGNLLSKTDFNGRTTTYRYDSVNRLLRKTPDPALNAPSVQFSYTATGQRASMQDASGETTYTYDNRDRLLEKATPQGTLSYSYDTQGHVRSIQSAHANGVKVQYDYDALNRLSTVTDQRLTAGETTYRYDAVGNLAGYVYPNGVEHQYTYNALNRLTDLTVKKGNTALARYSYTLGPSGNRLSVAELGGRTVNYHYDDLYRLTRETISGGTGPTGDISYVYDPVGNRLQRNSTVAGIANQTFSYDANDRLNTDAYDANGNTLQTDGRTFGYDADNRLTSANGGVSIVYDGDGNRVAKTVGGVTTQYLVDTLNPTGYAQVLEEIENGTVVRRYTYGLDLISQHQASGVSFYGYDGHGSVRGLTSSSRSSRNMCIINIL